MPIKLAIVNYKLKVEEKDLKMHLSLKGTTMNI